MDDSTTSARLRNEDESDDETALEKLIRERQGHPRPPFQSAPAKTLAQPLFERFFMPQIGWFSMSFDAVLRHLTPKIYMNAAFVDKCVSA